MLTEVCEDCLTLSTNVTVVAVGGVVMIVSNMKQQPHNGISLFIDGVAYTNPNLNFRCRTTSNILGQQMIYYCTGRRSGTVAVQTNTVFCDTDLRSQQIIITIEEQSATTQNRGWWYSCTFIVIESFKGCVISITISNN